MACGCQKVCIKGGTVEIDTTTPLDVNITNSAPIAVQGANNDPLNVLIVNPTPISVYGFGGAPVDVNIIAPAATTVVPDGVEIVDDVWSSPAGAKSVAYLTRTGTGAGNSVDIALATGGWNETQADKSWQWSVDGENEVFAAGAIVITANGTGSVRISWTT